MNVLNYPFDSAYILRKKKSLKSELLANDTVYIEKRIALLSGSTIGDVKPILELFLLDQGIKPIFYEGEYSRFYENSVFENQELLEFHPDTIYIHTSNKNIVDYPSVGDDDSVIHNTLLNTYKRFEHIWVELARRYNCPIIQNNFELLPYRVMGNSDVYHKYGKNNFINQLNTLMYEYANNNSGFYINDINYMASWYGLEKWSNPSQWYLYKYALDINAIPLLCQSIARIVKSIYGKNKKALAVDLDNTLWGGVIGDIGTENIKIGEETAEGRAHRAFQGYLKEVSSLGITLNICSKNEENIALEGFNHEACLLKKEDFVVIKANWNDKNINIKDIADELNIGTDSIVFVDDNPVEREIVKYNIPEVSIPEMSCPEDYIKILDQQGYFEITTLLEDDINRNKTYIANIQRQHMVTNVKDYSEFLKSLEMKCYMSLFGESIIPRVTQLINKTNQFNLTTRRVSENEVNAIAVDNKMIKLAARLSDKFGDNGIVTAIIANTQDEEAIIELWVMSCRVFKRNLELTIFDELVRECNNRGIKKIKGSYLCTNKNAAVKDLYQILGFEKIQESDSETNWEYIISEEYQIKNNVMEVIYVK